MNVTSLQAKACAFYPNIFNFYSIRDKNGGDADTSFFNFCSKYKIKGNQLAKRNKQTIVLTFPTRRNYRISRHCHQYCNYFLVKHKPWCGSIDNDWGDPITYPKLDDPGAILEDNHEIAQARYIEQFESFSQYVHISQLEMFYSDMGRLFQIREDLDVIYTE